MLHDAAFDLFYALAGERVQTGARCSLCLENGISFRFGMEAKKRRKSVGQGRTGSRFVPAGDFFLDGLDKVLRGGGKLLVRPVTEVDWGGDVGL